MSACRSLALAFVLAAAWLPRAAAQSTDVITLNPTSLTFSYTIGGALPAEQKVQVKRVGAGAAVDFTVTPPAGAPWMIVTPLAGKSGTPIGIRVNPTLLLAGSYSAAVQVTGAGAGSPCVVDVTLVVKNPPPTATVSPATVTVNFQTDQAAPAPQTLAVSTTGEPISFTAAASGGAWLSVTPANGIAVAGSPVTLSAALDVTGLVPAVYTGKITLNFTNAATRTLSVPVTLAVTAGTAVISSIWPTAAPVGSNDVTLTLRGQHFFKSSVVQAGSVTLTPTWVSTTVLLAVIPKAQLAAQGTLAITVTNAPQPASAPVDFTVNPPGPYIDTVVNAASFAAASPPNIAPGEIISIFGSGLGPSAVLLAAPSGGVFPTTLGTPATEVEFETDPVAGTWIAAPIIFAQANQVNAVAPFALTAGANKHLRVRYNGINSASFTYTGVTAEPGIFTTDASGRGQAAALNYDSTTGAYSINSASNPAAKGSTVVLYGAGGGATTPAPAQEGQVLAANAAAPTLNAAVSATVAGDGATVQSATGVPGSLAGLMQVNITVPSSVAAGKTLPVVLVVGGRASPGTATIAVK